MRTSRIMIRNKFYALGRLHMRIKIENELNENVDEGHENKYSRRLGRKDLSTHD